MSIALGSVLTLLQPIDEEHRALFRAIVSLAADKYNMSVK